MVMVINKWLLILLYITSELNGISYSFFIVTGNKFDEDLLDVIWYKKRMYDETNLIFKFQNFETLILRNLVAHIFLSKMAEPLINCEELSWSVSAFLQSKKTFLPYSVDLMVLFREALGQNDLHRVAADVSSRPIKTNNRSRCHSIPCVIISLGSTWWCCVAGWQAALTLTGFSIDSVFGLDRMGGLFELLSLGGRANLLQTCGH